MSEIENQLPADIDTLHALMVAACAERDAAIAERETAIGERDRALSQIDRLRHLLRQLQRAHFGKRSEKLDPDQLLLTLEDIEQAIAESEANDDKKDAIAAKVRAEKRRANRGALPRHLPRVDVTIAPEDTNCPCCRTPMHVIGEETSERLDVIPAQFRVIVTHRPKYACRACEEAPVQAPAPERLIKGRLPTEAMVAYVLAAKYAWHLPLYRQAQILLSQGVDGASTNPIRARGSRREAIGGPPRRPGPGHEFVEARGWPEIDEFCEHVGEVGLRIDAMQFAGLCRPPNYAERFRNDALLSRCCRQSNSVPFGIVWPLRAPQGRRAGALHSGFPLLMQHPICF